MNKLLLLLGVLVSARLTLQYVISHIYLIGVFAFGESTTFVLSHIGMSIDKILTIPIP